jgi:WD40 repeat protein
LGFAYEDDALPGEMIAEVEGERGALPLLAFAVARLWDTRDQGRKLLTRQAFEEIGGVGGALGQHADTTLKAIGDEGLPIVRELFRNLVTAEGTRAVREWNELLSVFGSHDGGAGLIPAREQASEILRRLIDARLLTSFEEEAVEGDGRRRVEVVHETLLTSWPRLVRWQTQDADAAQLRDQLRQAAKTWDEHDRNDDLLWTGSAYREYEVWRERYPGGLTEIEEAFAAAMTDHAKRRRRRRRIAVAAAFIVLLAVLAVVGVSRQQAIAEANRAEAQKLVALGMLRMDDYPTATLAYATRSIELADSEEARFLALEALWEGPTAFVVNENGTRQASFSHDGSWLVQMAGGELAVISRNGLQRVMDDSTGSGVLNLEPYFGGHEDILLALGPYGSGKEGRIALWSALEGRLLATAKPVDDPENYFVHGWGIGTDTKEPRALFALVKGDQLTVHALHADGRHEQLGRLRMTVPASQGAGYCVPTASAEWVGLVEGNEVSILRVEDGRLSDRVPLGRHEGDLHPFCDADPLGRFLLTVAQSGEIRLWDATGERAPTSIDGPRNFGYSALSSDGSLFFVQSAPEERASDVWIWSIDELTFHLQRRLGRVEPPASPIIDPIGLRLAMLGPAPATRLWSLAAPAGAEPILLRRGAVTSDRWPEFSKDGQWLASCDSSGLYLWPLARRYPAVVRRQPFARMEFGPQGRFLVIKAGRSLSLSALEGRVALPGRTVLEGSAELGDVAVSPDGELLAVVVGRDRLWIGTVDGGEHRELALDRPAFDPAFSPDGRFLALSAGRIVELEGLVSGHPDDELRVRRLAERSGEFGYQPTFTSDGRLLSAQDEGIVAWDVETGTREVIHEVENSYFAVSADGRRLLFYQVGEGGPLQDPAGPPMFFDLETGGAATLTTHGGQVWELALDREGTVAVTGDRNGIIRVGPVTGEEPHLLLGHDGEITHLAIDPLGRWIASSSDQDTSLRLWPMPDLSKPPLHTLPRAELIAKLRSLTNLRVVHDPESSTGWKLDHDPFPGWETVPTW